MACNIEARIIIVYNVYGLTDMDKPTAQCPPELTELSVQAVDDMNMVDILIRMQKNSIQLCIKTAIWQGIKCMSIVCGYIQTKHITTQTRENQCQIWQ